MVTGALRLRGGREGMLKILFFQRNFNDFVVWDSSLVGRTSNSRGQDSSFVRLDSSFVDRAAVLEAARIGARCF